MQGKRTLDADTIGYLAHRNGGGGAGAVLAGDNDAFKDLDAGLFSIFDLLVDFDGGAGLKRRKIGGRLALQVSLVKLIGGIHSRDILQGFEKVFKFRWHIGFQSHSFALHIGK